MFNKLIKKYPEIYFVLQFLLLFCVFYFGTEFWIGITSKGGYYNAFCEQYLNYIKWYRLLILNASVFFCNLFGYKSQVLNNTSVVGFNDFRVTMVYSCIGYGLLCFWAAFTVTYPTNYKRKLLWFALGFFILWIANAQGRSRRHS